MPAAFGTVLKTWRTQRRMSQLDLGLNANVSARHISFLETGRSRPSRSMVLHLCDQLEVPLQARNHLLSAAGHSSAYRCRALSEEDMKPVSSAVDWMLERHDPYPAIAMDRHWTILKTNRTAALLLAGLGVTDGDNLLTALIDNQPLRDAIDNLDEVLDHTIARLRTESAHLGGDPFLDTSLENLAKGRTSAEAAAHKVLPAFTPTRYSAGGQIFSFFSTFSQFGTAEDIALSEMKIEMMFPADDKTRELLLAMR